MTTPDEKPSPPEVKEPCAICGSVYRDQHTEFSSPGVVLHPFTPGQSDPDAPPAETAQCPHRGHPEHGEFCDECRPSPPAETARMSEEEFQNACTLVFLLGGTHGERSLKPLLDETARARSGEQTLYRDLCDALEREDARTKGEAWWRGEANAQYEKWQRAKTEIAALKAEIEEWQDASGLCVPSEERGGDPGGVKPKHLRQHMEEAESSAARLRAYVEKAPHLLGCHTRDTGHRLALKGKGCDGCPGCTCGKAAALAKEGT
jgi:hypothetical protein